jgi:hypothetical protein
MGWAMISGAAVIVAVFAIIIVLMRMEDAGQ